jgi:hypothetical protein
MCAEWDADVRPGAKCTGLVVVAVASLGGSGRVPMCAEWDADVRPGRVTCLNGANRVYSHRHASGHALRHKDMALEAVRLVLVAVLEIHRVNLLKPLDLKGAAAGGVVPLDIRDNKTVQLPP